MVICAALIVTLAMGVRQAFGLFLRPISMDLDIGRQAFGLAIALQNLLFGLVQPFVGAWADKHGAGKVIAAGALLYITGLVGATFAAGFIGLTISFGFMVGMSMAGTTFVVVIGAVSRVVPPEKRTLAFGLVTAGGSLGQFLVVPAAQGLLDWLDWKGALVVLSLLIALIVPLALGLAGKPDHSRTPDGPPLKAALSEAFAHPSFWFLNASFLVCGFHIAFVGTHLPAYIRDEGLSAGVGAGALALIGLFNIAGSWLWGAWAVSHPKKGLLALLYFGRAVAIMLFMIAPLSPASVLVFASAFGFLWLGTVPLTSGLVGQIYGIRHMSALFGIVFLSHQVGAFFGAWLAGLAFDATHSYSQMWIASIILALMAAAASLPVQERAITRAPSSA